MPIFRVKSVKIYTGQKKFTRTSSVRPRQIWGMTICIVFRVYPDNPNHHYASCHQTAVPLGLSAIKRKETQHYRPSMSATTNRVFSRWCNFYEYIWVSSSKTFQLLLTLWSVNNINRKFILGRSKKIPKRWYTRPLILWLDQGNQGDRREQDDQGEVSIIIFGMSKDLSRFQKYSICWAFQ